ncbi:hypothetical protein Bbelb_104540 [Branchiostoma belcheri]|nr:hypothetical protein Bbelb_104540 [Branchiostoma belcheri]
MRSGLARWKSEAVASGLGLFAWLGKPPRLESQRDLGAGRVKQREYEVGHAALKCAPSTPCLHQPASCCRTASSAGCYKLGGDETATLIFFSPPPPPLDNPVLFSNDTQSFVTPIAEGCCNCCQSVGEAERSSVPQRAAGKSKLKPACDGSNHSTSTQPLPRKPLTCKTLGLGLAMQQVPRRQRKNRGGLPGSGRTRSNAAILETALQTRSVPLLLTPRPTKIRGPQVIPHRKKEYAVVVGGAARAPEATRWKISEFSGAK